MTVDEPTTERELRAELTDLLCQAENNGVDVMGGWECRNGDDYPDWDVVVTEVQKPDQSD